MKSRIILIIIIYIIMCDTVYCESLSFDQKANLFLQKVTAHNLNEDFYCFLNFRVFEIYFNLELLQTQQDVKLYFDTLLNEYLFKPNQYCGVDFFCRDKFYDRIRMLKRMFHNEDSSFLIFFKSKVSNSILNKSFDEGMILDLYYQISQEFENENKP